MSTQILGPSGPAPKLGDGSLVMSFGSAVCGARWYEILRKSDERFSRKSHFCFFLKESPSGQQVKKTDSLYIVFKVLNTQRIRSRFAGFECAAGWAECVRFAPTPVQNAMWSIGRRRGRRTTSICTIFLCTL